MTLQVQQLIAFAVVLLVFVTLQLKRNAPTDVIFAGALGIFVICGITPPKVAWAGFANGAVIAIGSSLIVAAALRNTGALDSFSRKLLGSVRSEKGALGRLTAVLLPASAFLLNTAIMAMLLPVVISWCRRQHVAPSRLLLPMSYLAILGGTCTLVGTSTNFIVNEKLEAQYSEALVADASAGEQQNWLHEHANDLRPMSLFEISRVGVPCALGGALLLLFVSRRLLPDRTELLESLEDQRREYLVEMTVSQGCGLIDKTVEEGGLRSLPGLFLIEIDRDGDVIAPIAPSDRIHLNDRLVFTGVVATIVDLEKIPGLIPAADINYEISPEKADARSLVEVVLSPSSPLVGSSIRNANFRQLYNAAVVAVHRNGQRLPSKIGDIELLPGDTLLLQTAHGFVRTFRNRPDFYLVSGVADSKGRRHDKLLIACLITAGMIIWLLAQSFIPVDGSFSALAKAEVAMFVSALAFILTGCLKAADARRAIDVPLLVTIAAAIGVGDGFERCGGAGVVASFVLQFLDGNAMVSLIVLFVITLCLTEMISNVAVAAVMFYIAVDLAAQLGVSPRPFVMAITLAASLSFVSPIGYQTNLMVMGPGGYRPRDYIRAGLPMSILVSIIALIVIPFAWPF